MVDLDLLKKWDQRQCGPTSPASWGTGNTSKITKEQSQGQALPIRKTSQILLYFVNTEHDPNTRLEEGGCRACWGTLQKATMIRVDGDMAFILYKETWFHHSKEPWRKEDAGTKGRCWKLDQDEGTHRRDMESWYHDPLGSFPGRENRNRETRQELRGVEEQS